MYWYEGPPKMVAMPWVQWEINGVGGREVPRQ
jgi:hypothetical protein